MKGAEKAASRQNWNAQDKQHIKKTLKSKLFAELVEKTSIEAAKFDIMDEHLEAAIKQLGLKE